MSFKKRAIDWLLRNLDDLMNPYFWIEVITEFVLCTWIITVVIWALTTGAVAPTTSYFGLFGGFMIMCLIEGWRPLCGCPMNPVGVWGFFVAGRISFVRLFFYSAAEIGGAAAGGKIGYAMSSAEQMSTFVPIQPNPTLTIAQGMAFEAFLTFNLIIVALTVTHPKTQSIMASFPVAFCIGCGIMAGGNYTGGLQNPLVPFGPAVATGNFDKHFVVYWVGPYIGSTVAAVFWNLVYLAKTRIDIHRYPPIKWEDETNSNDNQLETKRKSSTAENDF